jgi:putative PIN family toxin of toxin-antitoxin system
MQSVEAAAKFPASAEGTAGPGARAIVLDTNIVLDLFIFADPATPALRAALEAKSLQWIATQVMRDELERVLAYTHIVPRMEFYKVTAEDVLARFDAHVELADVAPKARYVCKDADDQKFIDLAVAHQTLLLSKDKAVLTMAKRLRLLGVETAARFADLCTGRNLSIVQPSL